MVCSQYRASFAAHSVLIMFKLSLSLWTSIVCELSSSRSATTPGRYHYHFHSPWTPYPFLGETLFLALRKRSPRSRQCVKMSLCALICNLVSSAISSRHFCVQYLIRTAICAVNDLRDAVWTEKLFWLLGTLFAASSLDLTGSQMIFGRPQKNSETSPDFEAPLKIGQQTCKLQNAPC